ncbi:MAG: adenylyltransferase/cytidyltransferase family protein [Flavobacteriales bacterium]|nr:adenylyltransferase/cytidyltransferase family protein [Leptospiraceae bacterium]MCB9336320.1 adenylyltransferase/cytidyltransferase family protein [Flavobacteriales bacterium]
MHSESINALSSIKNQISDKENIRIGFLSGNFNVIHPGHLRLIKFAKEICDFLVIGILDNSSLGVIIDEKLRYEGVKSTIGVDYCFILRDTTEDFIKELRPHYVIKGKEHESKENPEKEVVESYGGKLIFSSGDIVYSSLNLLKQEFGEITFSTIEKPLDFLHRHSFTFEEIRETLYKFRNLKVCVIGDIIIDEYIDCEPQGMSQEDPTIVVTPIISNKYIGGAGIVASHAAGLGAKVFLLTISGQDSNHNFITTKLNDYNVEHYVIQDESRPTILKQRFRANGKTLLRVNHLRKHDIGSETIEKMINIIEGMILEFDLIIFSDFNYGCLPPTLVDKIIDLALKKNINMVADSQSSSQVGDVSRFKNMQILTPTEREARLAVRDFSSGLVVITEKLRKVSKAKNVLLTLGSEGLLINSESKSNVGWHTDQLPAFNRIPKDVSGAGDSLLVGASMALSVGEDIWKSSYIGSLVAACQVGRVGNIPIKIEDIIKELE